jgi:Leucine Rich repeat
MQRNEKRKIASSPDNLSSTSSPQERKTSKASKRTSLTSLELESKKATETTTLTTVDSYTNPIPPKPHDKLDDQKEQADEDESTMLLVEKELVLDLTEETEDYHVVLQRARDTVLNGDVHEFTMVSHLSRAFPVRDLADILMKTRNLESLSLFSIALSGDTKDFNLLAKVLRGHRQLRELHMVDCGMLGVWKNPNADSSESTSTAISRPLQQLPPTFATKPKIIAAVKSPPGGRAGDASTLGGPTDMSTTVTTAMSISGVTTAAMSISTMSDSKPRKPATSLATRDADTMVTAGAFEPPSVASKTSSTIWSNESSKRSKESSKRSKESSKRSKESSKRSKGSSKMSAGPPVPTMDAILNALATIETLENLELYGIPRKKFDSPSDGDRESVHRALLKEGEGDQDIPMVPMHFEDSYTHSDDDYLDDYDGDIRGIPGNARPGCHGTQKLSLLMSPESIGALCKAPALSNIGLEDLWLAHEHIALIAKALSQESCKVKELKMRGCNVDDRSSLALADMLKVNTSLEKLDLSYNRVGDEGCIAIASALHGNKTLRCLNIMGNDCAEDYDKESKGGCYEALMGLLKKNDTLKDLVMEPFEEDNDSTDDIPEFIFIPNTCEEADASSASE